MLVWRSKVMQPQDSEVPEERRWNCDTCRGPVANSTSSRSKETTEKASKNNQKRWVAAMSFFPKDTTSLFIASKDRQVKRGVKEVAKAIRKGEKGCAALFPFVLEFPADPQT